MAIVNEEIVEHINDMVIDINVLEKDNETLWRKNGIISINIDYYGTWLTPTELEKLGKLLIKKAKYIKANYDHLGRRKEVTNV